MTYISTKGYIMKLKEGFILSEVGGQTVVIPTGDIVDLKVVITLNETGKFIWEHLTSETDIDTLVEALLAEYDVDKETAELHVKAFTKTLSDNGFLA